MNVLIVEFERAAKIRKIAVYRFLIFLPESYRFKEYFRSKKWRKKKAVESSQNQ